MHHESCCFRFTINCLLTSPDDPIRQLKLNVIKTELTIFPLDLSFSCKPYFREWQNQLPGCSNLKYGWHHFTLLFPLLTQSIYKAHSFCLLIPLESIFFLLSFPVSLSSRPCHFSSLWLSFCPHFDHIPVCPLIWFNDFSKVHIWSCSFFLLKLLRDFNRAFRIK